MARRALIVLTPIAPATTGNGLAMRAALLTRAAGVDHDVHLVTVPVAGRQPAPPADLPGVVTRAELPVTEPTGTARDLVGWLGSTVWRDRTAGLLPLPAAVLAAPPAQAGAVGGAGAAGVLALRLSLAPLGLAVAETLGVPLLVDADDDDAGWLPDGDRWARVGHLCLPVATLVSASSADVARSLDERYRVAARVVPNAVEVPATPGPPEPGRLLMVANFTYRPNIEGSRFLATEVLPRLGPDWHLDLVGTPHPDVAALAGSSVTVAGWVADTRSWYGRATVVAAAVTGGSGTRIKVLEAMAAGRPLVANTPAIAGLPLTGGVHALIADDPDGFAAAVRRAATPEVGGPMAAAARALVADQYDSAQVIRTTADLLSAITRPESEPT